jgi:hypothetical protein
MKCCFALQEAGDAQRQASGLEPLAGVPAHPIGMTRRTGAPEHPYPLRRRGSEFNQLAPHPPGRLRAPRSGAAHQRRGSRDPPPLKSMAQPGQPCAAPPRPYHQPVFRPLCSAVEAV